MMSEDDVEALRFYRQSGVAPIRSIAIPMAAGVGTGFVLGTLYGIVTGFIVSFLLEANGSILVLRFILPLLVGVIPGFVVYRVARAGHIRSLRANIIMSMAVALVILYSSWAWYTTCLDVQWTFTPFVLWNRIIRIYEEGATSITGNGNSLRGFWLGLLWFLEAGVIFLVTEIGRASWRERG